MQCEWDASRIAIKEKSLGHSYTRNALKQGVFYSANREIVKRREFSDYLCVKKPFQPFASHNALAVLRIVLI